MSKQQLTLIITDLLENSASEVAQAGTCEPIAGRDSWIVHMTTAKVLSGLARALMEARDKS